MSKGPQSEGDITKGGKLAADKKPGSIGTHSPAYQAAAASTPQPTSSYSSSPTGRLVRLIIIIAIVAAAVQFLAAIDLIVKLALVSAILAYILNPLVNYLETRRLSRTMATVVILLALTAVVTAFVFLLLPTVKKEVQAIQAGDTVEKVSSIASQAEEWILDKMPFINKGDLRLEDRTLKFLKEDMGKQIFGFFLNTVSLLTSMLLIPFFIFFLLKDGPYFKKLLISLVPNRYFEFSLDLINKMDIQLGNYLRGQFMECTIVGVLSIGTLMLLDVKYYLIIGTFAGISNIVPYVGPIVGAIPAVLAGWFENGEIDKALVVALAMGGVQMLDNVVLKPVVIGKMVSMHPLAVLVLVIIGGKFFGILGMLLSIPAAAVVKVIVQEAFQNWRLYRFV